MFAVLFSAGNLAMLRLLLFSSVPEKRISRSQSLFARRYLLFVFFFLHILVSCCCGVQICPLAYFLVIEIRKFIIFGVWYCIKHLCDTPTLTGERMELRKPFCQSRLFLNAMSNGR